MIPTKPAFLRSAPTPQAPRRHYQDHRHWRGWRERSKANSTLPCSVEACEAPRRGLGRLCNQHRQRLESTGHPEVRRSLSQADWRPFVESAAAFVAAQLAAGHPSVVAAVKWADYELARACRLAAVPHPSRRSPHAIGYATRLARVARRGLDGRELVSRAIAYHLADDRDCFHKPRFRSEDHFKHQAGRLLLHRALIGRLAWQRTRRQDGPLLSLARYNDPSAGLRLYAFYRINKALGVVALLAADELRRRINTPSTHSPQDHHD